MNNGFEYVFLGHDTLHFLDEIEGFLNFLVLQVIDNEIQSSLWDHINQRRQGLEGVFTPSENNEIMPQKIIIVEDISSCRRILKHLKLSLCCLSIVKLIMIASFKVYTNYRV